MNAPDGWFESRNREEGDHVMLWPGGIHGRWEDARVRLCGPECPLPQPDEELPIFQDYRLLREIP